MVQTYVYEFICVGSVQWLTTISMRMVETYVLRVPYQKARREGAEQKNDGRTKQRHVQQAAPTDRLALMMGEAIV